MESSGKQAENRFQVLNHDQVSRLHEMLEDKLELHSRCEDLPPVQVTLRKLIKLVCEGLHSAGVTVRDTRLNGGGASYVIGMDKDASFNDIDLLFGVELNDLETVATIKSVVLQSLIEFFHPVSRQRTSREREMSGSSSSSIDHTPTPSPPSSPPPPPSSFLSPSKSSLLRTSSHLTTEAQVAETFVGKLVRVQNRRDSWYLLGLGRHGPGRMSVELKFVDRMRRQFEFSVDSFQIILDSLLKYSEFCHQPMTKHFYPTVVSEAVSGSFSEALYHLKHKLISTRNPEEIRGGGLLRYCRLLVEGYRADNHVNIRGLEPYMCSRFFIDFADLTSQRCRLLAYLDNHFDNDELKVTYLDTLRNVVAHSTVCLMGHEHRQTLYLIEDLIRQVCQQIRDRNSVVQLEEFNSDKWVLDQVFYGWSHFPQGYCPPNSTLPSPIQDNDLFYPVNNAENSNPTQEYHGSSTSTYNCV